MSPACTSLQRRVFTAARWFLTLAVPDPQLTPAVSLAAPHVTTSLSDVTAHLSTPPPCRILFKNEWEQPLGSFKLRGIGHLVRTAVQASLASANAPPVHVYSASGGNAGLAAAAAAQFYQVPCTVVLPVTLKPIFSEALKARGALVVVAGENLNAADEHLKHQILPALSRTSVTPVYCHPFDNKTIYEGHVLMMDEIAAQLLPLQRARLRGVVCAVGGGGLYNGIVMGLFKHGLAHVPVVAVEPVGAPTLTLLVAARRRIHLPGVNTLATLLACLYVSQDTLQLYQQHGATQVALVDDVDALDGVVGAYDDLGMVVEPACGAALASVYRRLDILTRAIPNLQPDDVVVVVACGGAGADVQTVTSEYRPVVRP